MKGVAYIKFELWEFQKVMDSFTVLSPYEIALNDRCDHILLPF